MNKKTTAIAERVWPERVRFKPRKSHHYLLQALEGLNTQEIAHELLSLANVGAMVMMGVISLGASKANGAIQEGGTASAAPGSSPPTSSRSPFSIDQIDAALDALDKTKAH